MKPFAEDMDYHGEPPAWDEDRRAHLRAELDEYCARLYGLTRDELRYILLHQQDERAMEFINMSSNAYRNLSRRMEDIEQLVQAHTALTQFRRARRAAEQAGGDLAQIAAVVNNLVTPPGRGRRAEVGALNRAAMVLLSAHLQGYIEDIYAEAAHYLLDTVHVNVESIIERGHDSFSNPHAFRIEQLFASIGMPKILTGIRWQKATNKSVRTRLSGYIHIRNEIAHGSQGPISKVKVEEFRRFVEVFAKRFDAKVGREIASVAGAAPW